VTYFPAASITRASFGTFTDVRGPIAEIRRSTTRIVALASGLATVAVDDRRADDCGRGIRRLAGVQDESGRQEQR
jgi:hypothetical protein